MCNDDDDSLDGPSMRSLAAPLSARKSRGSHKMTKTQGQRRLDTGFGNLDARCSWCGDPKARQADSCVDCAAGLERLAKRGKMKAAPLVDYFKPAIEVLRDKGFHRTNATSLAAMFIKRRGVCAITGKPMTTDPADPDAAVPFRDEKAQAISLACRSAAIHAKPGFY